MINKSFVLSVLVLMAAIAIIVLTSQRRVPRVIRTNLEDIPMKINGYAAAEDFFSDAVYKELNADAYVYRHYTNPAGEKVTLYIGYYGTAKGGRTPHNPYACLPSQGWAILDSGVISIPTRYAPGGVTLNYLISEKNNMVKYMLHWYQSAGTKVLDSGLKRNIQRFIGRLVYNRNDGAYIQVSMSRVGSPVKVIPRQLIQFTQAILNLLPEYWPEEE